LQLPPEARWQDLQTLFSAVGASPRVELITDADGQFHGVAMVHMRSVQDADNALGTVLCKVSRFVIALIKDRSFIANSFC
jgi:hypothetical protein